MALKRFHKILIANRGEIAYRISKTLRKMKIQPVGICIADEKTSPSFSLCEEIHVLPKNDLSAYLDMDEIVSIAKKSHAQAIHPGYGFLSENPEFASKCEAAGIIFIGPTPKVMRLMADKNKAKQFAESCGLSILKSVAEQKESDAQFEKDIRSLKLPIILKPLNGGGGKGMVIVRTWDNAKAEMDQCRATAKNAFGDGRILAEPLIEHATHLEVQVIGDQYGNVRHLFERDCTIQRRHQKIIEESPSPLLDKEALDAMKNQAVVLAQKSGYQNLGTVEFIVTQSQEFYFMEMNTRLQVEHPVTEMITGLDLVEKQVKIAQQLSLEEILPKKIVQKGHAIEARIYTENPSQSFLPSTGTIHRLKLPKQTQKLRIDCGIEQGTKIHHSFDPMIMKITVWGNNRATAIQGLAKALRETVVFGVHTNLNYLQWVLQHSDFVKGKYSTQWTAENLSSFQAYHPHAQDADQIIQSFEMELSRRDSDWYHDPWLSNTDRSISWKKDAFESSNIQGSIAKENNAYWIHTNGFTHVIPRVEKNYDEMDQDESNVVRAPMTGTIIQVHVKEGDQVHKKDLLVEMEAMKMQYKIHAPSDSKIGKILCQAKDIVEHESVLMELADA